MGLFLPAVIVPSLLLASMRLVLQPLREASEDRQTAEWAQQIACFFGMVDNISFAIVIPDSYSLVTGLGGSAAFSGVVVGFSKFGMALGALFTFLLLHTWPDFLWSQGREAWLGCASCNVLGASTYALVCWVASGRVPGADHWRNQLLVVLLAGRMLLGCGSGTRMLLGRALIGNLNEKDARPAHMTRFVFAVMIGLGFGPLAASAVKTFDMQFCELQHRRYEAVGLVALSLTLSQLVLAAHFPALDSITDVPLSARVAAGLQRHPAGLPSLPDGALGCACGRLEDNKAVVRMCLAFAFFRGLVVSGMEVGTSMLLEREFGWTPRWIGAAVGSAFLTSIPVMLFHARYGQRVSVDRCMVVLLAVSACGCCLLFAVRDPWLVGVDPGRRAALRIAALLLSDATVFPCAFFSDALNQGIMFQHLVRGGGCWLDISWVSLWQSLLVDGIARSIGPPLARGALHEDRNSYALQQLLLTLMIALVLVLGLMPQLRKSSPVQEQSSMQ